MHTTLRAYLTSPNVSLAVHPQANCSAARNDAASWRWPVVDQWRLWEDFNIENINTLFGTLLDTSFELADPPQPLKSPRQLRHENQFEFVLIRQNNFIVNEALRVACDHLPLDLVEWTRGGNDTGERTFPDWSGTLVSESDDETNLIPGDSKFTRNLFRAETDEIAKSLDSDRLAILSSPKSETVLARSCLQQVDNYATTHRVRYFYIITNKELFLCRRTTDQPLDTSIAVQRTKRARFSRPYSTPERLHAVPPSSPPSILLRNKGQAVVLDQVAANLPSSLSASPATPVGRKPCVSGYHC